MNNFVLRLVCNLTDVSGLSKHNHVVGNYLIMKASCGCELVFIFIGVDVIYQVFGVHCFRKSFVGTMNLIYIFEGTTL